MSKVRSSPTAVIRPLLKFGRGNAKLAPWVTTFSLPAGFACPFASSCRSFADPDTGRISDGPDLKVRCYKASEEARYESSRRNSWHNFRLLRKCQTSDEMAQLILDSLLPGAPVVRIHTGGDMFSLAYLQAWLTVAKERPRTLFYFYSKSLRFWVKHLDEIGDGHTPGLVENLVPTASWGGRDDDLILEYGLRSALIVFSEEEAAELGLSLDFDDSFAMSHGDDFALLIHGTQPRGTVAARAVATLRAQGIFGHGEKARLRLTTI
jgi:hypothetical protein